MKKILFPTDFSDHADHAKKLAFDLARKSGATLHALHSIDSNVDWTHMEMMTAGTAVMGPVSQEALYPSTKALIGQAQQQMNDLMMEAIQAGIDCVEHIAYNYVHKDICSLAKSANVDCIVMGTHGASGFKELFIGSNTQKVVRFAHCPVLTMRNELDDLNIRNIVYTSDFVVEKDVETMLSVVEFAKLFDAKIHLLYVNTPNYFEDSQSIMAKIKTFLSQAPDFDHRIEIYCDYHIDVGTLTFAEEIKADMIAVHTEAFKGFRRIWNNNVAERLVNHSQIPVFTCSCNKEYLDAIRRAQNS